MPSTLDRSKSNVANSEAKKSGNPIPVHCYAAKFGDDLARALLLKFAPPQSVVLDPFSGTGTTLVQAARLGMSGIGIDVDPIACLISKVQLRRYSKLWLKKFRADSTVAIDHLEQSLNLRKRHLGDGQPYGRFRINGYTAKLPGRPEIKFWFSKSHRLTLASLVSHMRGISDPKARDLFALAISASIIRKWPNTISRAMDIDHSRPHKMTPVNSSISWNFGLFRKVLQQTTDILVVKASQHPVTATGSKILHGDCIQVMRRLPDSSIDCVLTSPPYVNAINYPRAHKFAEWWLYPEASICQAKNYVGLRRKDHLKISDQLSSILSRHKCDLSLIAGYDRSMARQVTHYFEDIFSVMANCHRMLKPKSPAVVVLADNICNGKRIPVISVVADIMKNIGFKRVNFELREIRPTRRRYPLAFSGVMRTEAIITGLK